MGQATSTVGLVNDVQGCTMYCQIGANQQVVGWALAGFVGGVSGVSGAPGKTGSVAELMVPFIETFSEGVSFAYTTTAIAEYAKKNGVNPDLQSVTMPFLAKYAREELRLNRSPSYGGVYESDRVTLSLVLQANTMAVCKTGKDTADLYVGKFTVWSGWRSKLRNNYYLSREMKNLKKSKLRFVTKATGTPSQRPAKRHLLELRSVNETEVATASHLNDMD